MCTSTTRLSVGLSSRHAVSEMHLGRERRVERVPAQREDLPDLVWRDVVLGPPLVPRWRVAGNFFEPMVVAVHVAGGQRGKVLQLAAPSASSVPRTAYRIANGSRQSAERGPTQMWLAEMIWDATLKHHTAHQCRTLQTVSQKAPPVRAYRVLSRCATSRLRGHRWDRHAGQDRGGSEQAVKTCQCWAFLAKASTKRSIPGALWPLRGGF